MTDQQKTIIIEMLESKKQEILNYDMRETWATETLEAIAALIDQLHPKG